MPRRSTVKRPPKLPEIKVNLDQQTDAEAHFAFLLRTIGRELPPVEPQWYIPEDNKRRAGENRYRADFAWPEYRVIVEVEGPAHCIAEKHGRDCLRFSWLAYWGYRVFRITPKQMQDNPHILFKLLGEILRGKHDE